MITLHGSGGNPHREENGRIGLEQRPVPCAPTPSVTVASSACAWSAETKQAFKTTEFWAMLGVIVAILVSAAAIKGGDTGAADEFIARQAAALRIVAGAYLISRELAKAGSSDPYTEAHDDSSGSRH